HEAGHAVAAYALRFPSGGVFIKLPTAGRIEMAHLERDHDAVEIGRSYLKGLGENLAKSMLSECTVCEMGRAVNIAMNQVPVKEADGYASDDQDFLNESYRFSELDPDEIA